MGAVESERASTVGKARIHSPRCFLLFRTQGGECHEDERRGSFIVHERNKMFKCAPQPLVHLRPGLHP